MNHLIAPSILAADFAHLGNDIRMINESNADWIHVDVMDGRFVPNISIGLPVVEAIKSVAKKPLDVHLMIVEPENYITAFKNAGADNLTIHMEACTHLHKAIHTIKELGMKAGVALNPHTPVSSLEDIIGDIDIVCMMAVNPGFGGQKFITQTLEKIQKLKHLLQERQARVLIEVDGGVVPDNAIKILKAGADVLVAGSSVFKSGDPRKAITDLKNMDVNTIYA